MTIDTVLKNIYTYIAGRKQETQIFSEDEMRIGKEHIKH